MKEWWEWVIGLNCDVSETWNKLEELTHDVDPDKKEIVKLMLLNQERLAKGEDPDQLVNEPLRRAIKAITKGPVY